MLNLPGTKTAVPVVTANRVEAPICICVLRSKAAFIPYTFERERERERERPWISVH